MNKVLIDDLINGLKRFRRATTRRGKRPVMKINEEKVIGEIRFAKRMVPPGPYHPELQEYK